MHGFIRKWIIQGPHGGLRGGSTTLLLSKLYLLCYNGSLKRQALLIVFASKYKRDGHEKNSEHDVCTIDFEFKTYCGVELSFSTL